MAKKKTLPSEVVSSEAYVKDFFDMVVPSTIKFNVDHFVCGDSFRCVWAIKEYPPNTTDQAILSRFGDKEAVTLHMYTRFVDGLEQRKILQNASRKNKMLANSNDLEDSVMGEGNLYDVVELMNDLRKNREPLLHCAVFLELSANSLEKLRELQADISMEMTREKLSVDRLTLRQQEYKDLCNNLGGCYIDLMSGQYIINPLEPKEWSDNADDVDDDAPEAFRKATRLSQHISYLKDFFRVYKDFNDAQIDALEILLTKLYGKFGIHDNTDYDKLKAEDYPIMADLYSIVEDEYMKYEKGSKSLFTEDLLRELCLGLNSMCVGAESKFFNGHTNISDDKFICFGVKGLMEANKKLKDAMLFNILSYMNHKLLTKGHTAASIDELYLFLTNLTAIEYIRNASKRVRKKESSIILASQNIEDFLLPDIKEFTKPLFSIPTHQFLFNGGNINAKDYIDALQLEDSEFDLIKYPERGTCLFKCGNERYLLQVKAPDYKAKLFGEAGGR